MIVTLILATEMIERTMSLRPVGSRSRSTPDRLTSTLTLRPSLTMNWLSTRDWRLRFNWPTRKATLSDCRARDPERLATRNSKRRTIPLKINATTIWTRSIASGTDIPVGYDDGIQGEGRIQTGDKTEIRRRCRSKDVGEGSFQNPFPQVPWKGIRKEEDG